MAYRAIGLLGETFRQRSDAGLEANLGFYPAGQQSLHVHDRPCLSILISGLGVDRSRRSELLQPPLTAVFHPTNEPHANDIGAGGVVGFTLSFDAYWLGRHELSEKQLGGHRALPTSVKWRLRMLRALCLAFSSAPTASADLDLLVVETLATFATPAAHNPSEPIVPRYLRRAEEFLRANFAGPISLRSVAGEAKVHPVYLARVFRSHFGCSVGEYIRKLRVTAAGEMILRSDVPLAAAAGAAGFCDQPHLCRTFAKTLGLSPTALRALTRNWNTRSGERLLKLN